MGVFDRMRRLLVLALALLFASVAANEDRGVVSQAAEGNEQVLLETRVESAVTQSPATPTDKQGSYGKILRTCMNTCGGLCRQLCHKFKHIKVCNGCIRGCNKRCELKEEIALESDPEKMAATFSGTLPYGTPP